MLIRINCRLQIPIPIIATDILESNSEYDEACQGDVIESSQ